MKKYILTESQIRNLVNNVIDEGGQKKGETKYTPEYLEKIKEKYKGKLLSNFRTGEDRAAYFYVKTKGKDFIQDFTKEMIRTQRLSYTKDELRVIAKKYKTRTEFSDSDSGAYTAALNFGPIIVDPITQQKKNTLGFLNDICSHMYVTKDASNRLVYAHEFYDENDKPVAVYVGLTYDSEKRKEQHIKGVSLYGKENLSPVTKFMKEHQTYKHKYKELTDYINADDAAKMEIFWEKKYNDNGWVILNIAPTGRLGAYYKISNKKLIETLDYIYDIEGVKDIKNLRKKYVDIYHALNTRAKKSPIFNDYLNKFQKTYQTEDEIFNEAKTYKSYKDFLENESLYNKVLNRGLLGKIKEYFNVPIYDDEYYINKALKFNNYSDFKKNDSTYRAVLRRKLLPKVKELFAQRKLEQQNEPVE
jgi:hypothetical protein